MALGYKSPRKQSLSVQSLPGLICIFCGAVSWMSSAAHTCIIINYMYIACALTQPYNTILTIAFSWKGLANTSTWSAGIVRTVHVLLVLTIGFEHAWWGASGAIWWVEVRAPLWWFPPITCTAQHSMLDKDFNGFPLLMRIIVLCDEVCMREVLQCWCLVAPSLSECHAAIVCHAFWCLLLG